MPQEAEAGKRFARDMRRIREAHHFSVSDLHDETKIPVSLIEAFEETGLFDHPQFNRVYLRSFVRTYANVVGVDAEEALDALEDALSGSYAGGLAASYLDEEAEEEPAEEPEEEFADEDAAAEAVSAEERSQEPETQQAEEREPPIVSTTSEAAASYEETTSEDDEEEEVDEDWSAQSPPSAARAGAAAGAAGSADAAASSESTATSRRAGTSRRHKARDTGGVDRRWILAGGLLIIIAVVVWILISVLGDSERQATQPVAAADTAQVEDTTQAPQPAAEPVNVPAVGDTMDVRIIAAQGSVDPIRVTVDDDLRRPYWIDQGDSMAFDPTDRIVIEELLDNINLKVEGIEYPTDRRDAQGRIVITRDTLQNFFASLQQGP